MRFPLPQFLCAVLLALLTGAGTVRGDEPATQFSAEAAGAEKTASSTWRFQVSAAGPGHYRAVVYGMAPETLTSPAVIAVSLEDGIRKMRTIIQSRQKQGRVDAIRVDFDGKPRTVTVESPDADITKIEFVPVREAAVPSDAENYRPKVVPPRRPSPRSGQC